MGPIDFSGLWYAGVVVGILIAAAFFGLGLGVYWLLQHIDIVWTWK